MNSTGIVFHLLAKLVNDSSIIPLEHYKPDRREEEDIY
jgi:hypothetical protein